MNTACDKLEESFKILSVLEHFGPLSDPSISVQLLQAFHGSDWIPRSSDKPATGARPSVQSPGFELYIAIIHSVLIQSWLRDVPTRLHSP